MGKCALVIVLTLASCVPYSQWDMAEIPQIGSIVEATFWVHDNIEYQSEEKNSWKTPLQTLEDGYGDCEDLSILLMYIVNINIGISPDLIIVNTLPNRYHTQTEYLGIRYDPMEPFEAVEWPIVVRYSYGVTMWLATYLRSMKNAS